MNHTNVENLDWLDEITDADFCIIDDFFKTTVYQDIRSFFERHETKDVFTKAGIGAQAQQNINTEIRGDYSYWLDRRRDVEISCFFEVAQELIYIFNRHCYLSLSDYEFHFAVYPVGSFYKKHIDQFKGRSNRLITFILYFNDSWQEGDGGELKIYSEDGTIIVPPLANRVVMFKSDKLYHEVLKANKARRSLTGWLLYAPQGLGGMIG